MGIHRLCRPGALTGRVFQQAAREFAALLGFCSLMHLPATAAVPGDSGLTAFRAVTTNLDGSGIHVAQPEASLTTNLLTFEVNPASVSQPALSYVYTTFNGTTDSFPNALGFESSHADAVGGIFYGITFVVETNVAGVDNFEADFFYSNYISDLTLPDIGDQVVNQSFTFGPLSAADQESVDSDYDNYAVQNQTLFISAADNLGNNPVVCAPGSDYNCISVGAYANGTYFNSIGPTIDNGRCKPDITAIGEATSFSTPLVAGAATVLMQAGLRRRRREGSRRSHGYPHHQGAFIERGRQTTRLDEFNRFAPRCAVWQRSDEFA